MGVLAAKQSDGTYTAKLVNCGDSRGVIIKCPQSLRRKIKRRGSAIVESVDHKPSNAKEQSRIKAAGGCVRGDRPPRIDGDLAVSRGLGDFKYKADRRLPPSAQKVTCEPDVYEVSGLQSGALVILACDGLWDVMTTEEVTSLVYDNLRKGAAIDLSKIASNLVQTSLRKKSRDNVTVLVAQVADRVANVGGDTSAALDPGIHENKTNLEGDLDKNAEHSFVVSAN